MAYCRKPFSSDTDIRFSILLPDNRQRSAHAPVSSTDIRLIVEQELKSYCYVLRKVCVMALTGLSASTVALKKRF